MNIENIIKLLNNEKKELELLSFNNKESRNPVILDQQSVGRLSRMDAIQQQNMHLANENIRRYRIEIINFTLKRINHEDFGYCVACDEIISEKRIEADPTVTKCISCA